MKSDIFRTIILILEDVISIFLKFFIATILVAVLLQNGWICNIAYEVSYELFWRIYSCFIPIIVIIVFYKGLSGKYTYELTKISIMGNAVQAKEEKYGKTD